MRAAPFLLFAAAAWAQSLNVYSEFARIGPDGRVIAPEVPREILSPALVRSGYTSFQLVVDASPDRHWRLFMGQNPENAVRVTLYREKGEGLEPVELPVEGDGSQVFWMDLWTDRNAPVARIKVEPELYIKDDWVTYPMEARVMEARVPETSGVSHLGIPCRINMSAAVTPMSARQTRNAEQDGALAARLPREELEKLAVFCDTPAPSNRNRFWTEGYLRIRDYLFRLR